LALTWWTREGVLAAMAVNWYEPIDMDVYKPCSSTPQDGGVTFKGPKENGGGHELLPGLQWLQAILRKDKVDVKNYNN
jgi:hypothetical protein